MHVCGNSWKFLSSFWELRQMAVIRFTFPMTSVSWFLEEAYLNPRWPWNDLCNLVPRLFHGSGRKVPGAGLDTELEKYWDTENLVLHVVTQESNMSGRTAPKALQAAISDGLLGPCTSLVPCPALSQNLALFYDLEEFEAGFDRAVHAFGDGRLKFRWQIS